MSISNASQFFEHGAIMYIIPSACCGWLKHFLKTDGLSWPWEIALDLLSLPQISESFCVPPVLLLSHLSDKVAGVERLCSAETAAGVLLFLLLWLGLQVLSLGWQVR